MNIVKLGGSLVNPDGNYDNALINSFIDLVKEKDEKFIFVVGGGKLCRHIQDAADEFLHKSLPKEQWNNARDEIGTCVTKINAWYVLNKFKGVLGDQVHGDIIRDVHTKVESSARIFIGAGVKPGHSTDMDMMLLARTFDATNVFKITNFKFVKDVKPADLVGVSDDEMKSRLDAAKDLTHMSWDKLFDLVGDTWIGGMNTPFDPSAVKIGVEMKKSLALYIGTKDAFFDVMKGNNFVGTLVEK